MPLSSRCDSVARLALTTSSMIDAYRLIRKMRGGSQAHLIEATDGNSYVVKFANNPQGRRTLVNEWIGSVVLHHLGIATPETVPVHVSKTFLTENPEVYLQLRTRRQSIQPGWHFGSRFPGDPATTAVYDFVPDALLVRIENIADFRGALAFDKWMGTADSRQAIFFHSKMKKGRSSPAWEPERVMIAQMIDHGRIFEGAQWHLGDSPIQGLYFRPVVYQAVRGLQDFEPWLTGIVNFPEDVVDRAAKRIPTLWLAGEGAVLEALLARLLQRRKSVPDLICQCHSDRSNPFPLWR
jgi:hypothetical protein